MSGRRKWRLAFVAGLTMVRAPLILVFLLITILWNRPLGDGWFCVAFGAMILSAVTDLLDGWFARKLDVVTRFGGYFDPLVDKIFYLATLPTLVYLAAQAVSDEAGQAHAVSILHARLLLALTVFFLLRDQWVSFLRSLGAIHGRSGKANWSGKLRTVIAFPTICVIYYYIEAPKDWWLRVPMWVVFGLELLGIAVSLLSLWVYTAAYWPYITHEFTAVDSPPADDPPAGA
jgi:CDP-diacylglycerol--glycerol-3-phosphate 3-phosphatidyltransferase